MGIIGDLARFTQYQAATALETAAANPSGGGGEGIGLGMGLAMGHKMAEAIGNPVTGGSAIGSAAVGSSAPGGPPPLPSNAPRYYLGVRGQQIGPFDMNGLRLEIHSGRLTKSTLVWKDGMSSWEPADRIPEVTTLFPTDGPPPLPG